MSEEGQRRTRQRGCDRKVVVGRATRSVIRRDKREGSEEMKQANERLIKRNQRWQG